MNVCGGSAEAKSTDSWGPTAFVWMAWGLLSLSCVVFVARFGSNVPYMDEWDSVVPVVSGQRAFSISYLWAQHNEFRWPLPKLIWFGLSRLAHWDFRAGMYAGAVVLSAAAALLLMTIRRLRGHWWYADAFLPLTLLHFGQYENLLMSTQLCYTLPVLLLAIVFSSLAGSSTVLRFRETLLAGMATCGLALCGATGLGVCPGLAIWLSCMAIGQWRAGHRRSGALTLGLGILPILIGAFYFYHFNWHGAVAREPSVRAISRGAAQCLAIAAGAGACAVNIVGQPLQGACCIDGGCTQWKWIALVSVVLMTAALAGMVHAFWRRTTERPRILGFVLFMGAVAVLAPVIGWGRAQLAPYAGFGPRYVVVCIPLWWATYCAWSIATSVEMAKLVQMILMVLAGIPFFSNECVGLAAGKERRAAIHHFEKALACGEPCPVLASHADAIYPVPDALQARFSALHRAGIGRFRTLNDPRYEVVSVPLTDGEMEAMTGPPGALVTQGPKSKAIFRLPSSQFVEAVQVQLVIVNGGGAATVRCTWVDHSTPQVRRGDSERTYWTPTGLRCLTFPVRRRIDELQIAPDTKPCLVCLTKLVLLCKESDAHASLVRREAMSGLR